MLLFRVESPRNIYNSFTYGNLRITDLKSPQDLRKRKKQMKSKKRVSHINPRKTTTVTNVV